jgi:AcrR family transcriptional regulator
MNMSPKNPTQTREKILHAAAQSIVHTGFDGFTLDQVALAAHVSKGGLLHHFPTKDSLLQGLVAYLADLFEQRLNAEIAAEPIGSPGRWTRAYIRASFFSEAGEDALVAALGTAVIAHPQLIEAFRTCFDYLDAIPDDGIPAVRILAIRLACDGLWLSELAGMPVVLEPQRTELMHELLRMSI